MKYKVIEGCALYDLLVALRERVHAADEAARELALSRGAYSFSGGRELGGGIRAFCFKEKPEGYKLLQHPDFYYPKVSLKANRDLMAAIAVLPLVRDKELIDLVGFKSGSAIDEVSQGWRRTFRPGLLWAKDQEIALIDTGLGTCAPHPDMQEILESEYLALQGK